MLFRYLIFTFLGVLALGVTGNPVFRVNSGSPKRRQVPAHYDLHERHLPAWSEDWIRRRKVPSSVVLPMRIGIKQRNLEAGEEKLLDISNPASANYGKHMTAKEVIDFFSPPQPTVDSIIGWLTESGIAAERIGLSVNKQWIQFDARVEEVENLLFADFFLWEHHSGSKDISTQEYHLPNHLREHVDYITPGIRLRVRETKANTKEDVQKRGFVNSNGQHAGPDTTSLTGFPNPNSSTCSIYVTADCTRAQYSIPEGTTAFPGNKLGIFESSNDHYSRHDLDVYFSTLYPHIPNGTYPEERLIDGAVGAVEDPNTSNITAKYGGESSLDFDSSMPLVYPQGVVLYQTDDQYYETHGRGFWNTFLDAIDGSYCTYSAFGETGDASIDPAYPDPAGYQGELQCGVYEPTNVISISYHVTEGTLPDSYFKRQCNEWMKLGLQGVTVVTSSGDAGVGIASECGGAQKQIFSPHSAASCPYVLAVGSTEWDRFDNSTAEQPFEKLNEISTTRFASGGGFSNIFGVASWQRDAITAYFDKVTPPFSAYHHFIENGNYSSVTGGVYHHGGRAYPDVAAVGDRQVCLVHGVWELIGGTSLSSPVFASVLTLINEERLNAGKSTLGFVTPVLYANAHVFNDVVEGSNPGCNGSPGFTATEGWDPVSGLGSPNYPKLRDLLLNL